MHDDDSDDDWDPKFGASGEQARTTSQIKRNRLDLERRYVFLCPTALSKQFPSLPEEAKNAALLVFRCSRSLLFPDRQRGARLKRLAPKVDCGPVPRARPPHGHWGAGQPHTSLEAALYRQDYANVFLQWVITKEKEGCVFWCKPEQDLEKMSRFFQEKLDPVSETQYKPLRLDPTWWRVRFRRSAARYVGVPTGILAALGAAAALAGGKGGGKGGAGGTYTNDLDVSSLQELIYQSNPTLEPVARWPHAPSMRFLPRVPPKERTSGPGDPGTDDWRCKGYIEPSSSLSPGGPCIDACRIGEWPRKATDKLDSLHALWEAQDSASPRHLHRIAPSSGRPSTSLSVGRGGMALALQPLTAR